MSHRQQRPQEQSMPDYEPDKWYRQGNQWIRYNSSKGRWEGEDGKPLAPSAETTFRPGASKTSKRPVRHDTLHEDDSPEREETASQRDVIQALRGLSLRGNNQVHTITDDKSGIKSTVETGHPSNVTAAELQRQGFSVQKALVESQEGRKSRKGKESSKSRYQVSSSPLQMFSVIEMRWAEPMPGAGSTVITRRHGDSGITRLRRFVVVGPGEEYCAAMYGDPSGPVATAKLTYSSRPISTYGGCGVVARDLVKSNHTIIYTGDAPPQLLPGEDPIRVRNHVDSLRLPFIKVNATKPYEQLDPNSRLNYSKTYQINQKSVEVYIFGHVARDSQAPLFNNCKLVQHNIRGSGPQAGATSDIESIVSRDSETIRDYHHRTDSVQLSSTGATRAGSSQTVVDASSKPATHGSSTQQFELLRRRAQQYHADLRELSEEQLTMLARLPEGEQVKYLLRILEKQSPQLFARYVAARRAQTALDEGDSASADDGDSDDE